MLLHYTNSFSLGFRGARTPSQGAALWQTFTPARGSGRSSAPPTGLRAVLYGSGDSGPVSEL